MYSDNPASKRYWVDPGQPTTFTAKTDIQRREMLLCVWWDIRRVLHFELMKSVERITAQCCRAQLMKLNTEIEQQRPWSDKGRRPVILLPYYAKHYVADIAKTTVEQLKLKFLPHPAYFPDLATSDFPLFRPTQYFLKQQMLRNDGKLENFITGFSARNLPLTNKSIFCCLENGKKVIDADGNYFVE